MKTTKTRFTYSAPTVRSYPYPNAAEPGYFAQKLLDCITAVVTGIGAITVMFFLMTM